MENWKIAEYTRYYNSEEFQQSYLYSGDDLGALWSEDKTYFRLWAPTAERVQLNLFHTGDKPDLYVSHEMVKEEFGTWIMTVDGNLHGVYYTYSVTIEGQTREAVDPYAKAVGVNGDRGMVVDLSSTDPEGFSYDIRPPFNETNDAIIYELHVRDFSIDCSAGINAKGKYLAFTEIGTVNSYKDMTGIDYLTELGVTHVHLLPIFDYATVDETKLHENQFNWGYDPKNYNTPEGSYATDPYHGEVRIKEMKQMIQALHKSGIRVIMDVVYNHTMASFDSNLNKIVPGYYYRTTGEGDFSNASGCGNETASERFMVRKFMLDSILYWAEEYHIDGFRFDLMGIHDITTMNSIRDALDEIDPTILMYGEGWTGGGSVLPDWERSMKFNMKKLSTRIAAFSDDIRDGIKGSVFLAHEKGYVSGKEGMEETIKFGVTAAIWHDQVDYWKVNYSGGPWAAQPSQTINYVSSHDNLTLWDKLTLSTPWESKENRLRMNLLSAAIVLTSQGIPFFQAGEEFLRSKPINEEGTEFEDNSYRSSDRVNSLKWDLRTIHSEVFHYYRGLIELRKAHPLFRMRTAETMSKNLRFLSGMEPNVIAFSLSQVVFLQEESAEEILVIYNANRDAKTIYLPEGEWKVYVKGTRAGMKLLSIITDQVISVDPISAVVMMK
jgi:pullulanase